MQIFAAGNPDPVHFFFESGFSGCKFDDLKLLSIRKQQQKGL
jgi:hypothetical protein